MVCGIGSVESVQACLSYVHRAHPIYAVATFTPLQRDLPNEDERSLRCPVERASL